MKRGHHHGVILRALGDSIAFCPPLIINEAEIDLMLDRFALALEDTLRDGSGARIDRGPSPCLCSVKLVPARGAHQKVGGVLIHRTTASVFPGLVQLCCVLLLK